MSPLPRIVAAKSLCNSWKDCRNDLGERERERGRAAFELTSTRPPSQAPLPVPLPTTSRGVVRSVVGRGGYYCIPLDRAHHCVPGVPTATSLGL